MRKHGPISHRETTLEKLHARGYRGGRGTHRTRSPLTNGRRGGPGLPGARMRVGRQVESFRQFRRSPGALPPLIQAQILRALARLPTVSFPKGLASLPTLRLHPTSALTKGENDNV